MSAARTAGARNNARLVSDRGSEPAVSDHEQAGQDAWARGLAGPELPPIPNCLLPTHHCESTASSRTPARLPGKEEKEVVPLERKQKPW